jgi:hypothetical protein
MLPLIEQTVRRCAPPFFPLTGKRVSFPVGPVVTKVYAAAELHRSSTGTHTGLIGSNSSEEMELRQ